MGDRYELDDAAAAALWMLMLEKDKAIEHMGALYEDGGIKHSDTVSGSGENVKGTIRIPTGSLRGLFHNHPLKEGLGERDMEQHKFSEDDIAKARRMGVPSYISAGDRVRRYDPKGPRNEKTQEVLAEFPMQQFREYLMQELLGRDADDPRGLYRGQGGP